VFLDDHGRYVLEDGTPVAEQPVSMRKALTGMAVTVALVVVIPLLIGFAAYRHVVSDQIDRVNNERIARTQAINEFIYDQCVQAEIRDVVIVQQLQAAIRRARASLPPGSAILESQLQTLRDGIAVLEPANEPDCKPPPAVQPKGENP
jgi:hypothetical protein